MNEKLRKSFEKMALIMSPANNHVAYRKLLATVQRKDPCIPYFGMSALTEVEGGGEGREGGRGWRRREGEGGGEGREVGKGWREGGKGGPMLLC